MKRVERGNYIDISYSGSYTEDERKKLNPNSSYRPYFQLKCPHRLSFYEVPPTEEIDLEEFEKLALNRLHLLRAIETATVRQLKDEEYHNKLKAIEDKYLPLHSNEASRGYDIESERRNDILSHYILRLGFCMKEDTRRWLVTYENILFKWRFQNEKAEERFKFIQSCLPFLTTVGDEEKSKFQQGLIDASGQQSFLDSFYKVPFENVCDLVMRRAVFVHSGWAYVPRSESLSILSSLFRSRLEQHLDETARALPRLNEEDRLLPMLLGLSKSPDDLGTAASMGIMSEKLAHGDVDKASVHFPPCMLHLHQKLKEESHLKHGGRMQYGLYLKSIGLNLEEAVLFWKKSFSKKTNEDAFQKSYLYNIRHNYGQEGKRANYAPYSCHKIITTNPPYSGDHHGCPFKHFGVDNLTSFLNNLRLPGAKLGQKALTPASVKEIVELASQHHYQIACTRLFELSRKLNSKSLESIVYPHQFYEWSTQGAPTTTATTTTTSEHKESQPESVL